MNKDLRSDNPARRRLLRTAAIAFMLAVSFAAGYWSHRISSPPHAPHTQIRMDGFKYIHPLLECDVTGPFSPSAHPDMRPFRSVIQKTVRELLADGTTRKISVYFRDLNSSTSFGINENELFPSASLMKVPLMIAILQRAESDNALLKKQLTSWNEPDKYREQHFRPREVLERGKPYSVDDLLERMIAYSDNDSSLLLADAFGMKIVDDMLDDLDIPVDTQSRDPNRMSLRNYSAFFRILYNASYLNFAMSEKALGFMARSTFDQGIRAGLPPGVQTAGKFGEYSWNPYYLHEVAIVYYPDHPYLLGVMTMGGNPESLGGVIRSISRAIYAEFERQHR